MAKNQQKMKSSCCNRKQNDRKEVDTMAKKKQISAQSKASMKYSYEYQKQIKFNLNQKYDQDIIEYLENLPNKQGYIKELIRADIAKNK